MAQSGMESFWLAFIPLFVAFDTVGLVPLYWALAREVPGAQRREAVDQAVLVAFLVGLVFLLVSGEIFRAMGIRMADILIAGGMILFALALRDLLQADKTQYGSREAIGVVPLGVPLIVGPAVLTTVLLTRERYGLWPTVWALSLNMLLTWIALQVADRLIQWLGSNGAKVVSKVSGLILAAFAVMLVRHGINDFLVGLRGAGLP